MISQGEDNTSSKSDNENNEDQEDEGELDEMDRLMFATMERNKQEFKRCTQKKSKIFNQK